MASVGVRLGWSKSKVSRVERGLSRRVSLEDVGRLAATVGLRASLKLFPSGQPLRDIGQVQLLAALNARMHAVWRHRQEVPVPSPGDFRAADQLSTIPGCRLMIEAYRRFTDSQLQTRSARTKQRDLGADRLLLLIEDTKTNRAAVAAAGEDLRRSFPVSQRAMLAALAAGRDPGGDGVVFLRRPSPKPAGVAPDATNSE
jgi:transcriptional regulator with XRE-family HTH domain